MELNTACRDDLNFSQYAKYNCYRMQLSFELLGRHEIWLPLKSLQSHVGWCENVCDPIGQRKYEKRFFVLSLQYYDVGIRTLKLICCTSIKKPWRALVAARVP